MEVVAAGRRARDAGGVALDIAAPDFPSRLARLAPRLVIHCVGPFQHQDYRVARACIGCGAHYVDLADGRGFVEGFAAALDGEARAANVTCISGASTLPALSAAVVDALSASLTQIDTIDTVIAPGQRAPRGEATLAGVFDYIGRRFDVWDRRRWRASWGWMDLRRVEVAGGRRWSAACDVPDLALFPSRHPSVARVTFRAALEFGLQHAALWALAALRRAGVPLPATRIAMALQRWAPAFDRFAGDRGGMSVAVSGPVAGGRRVRRTWQVLTPAIAGPEIPCFAAILLARRIARGRAPPPGAWPCMGLLALDDFAPLFAQWNMTTRIDERPA